MNITDYIVECLKKGKTVEIPGIGTWKSVNETAHFDEQTATFYPTRTVVNFESRTAGNEEFIAYIADSECVPTDVAKQMVRNYAEVLDEKLSKEGTVTIGMLGDLQSQGGSKSFASKPLSSDQSSPLAGIKTYNNAISEDPFAIFDPAKREVLAAKQQQEAAAAAEAARLSGVANIVGGHDVMKGNETVELTPQEVREREKLVKEEMKRLKQEEKDKEREAREAAIREQDDARRADGEATPEDIEAQKKAEKEELEAKKRAEKEELEAKKRAEKEEMEAKKKAEKEEMEAKKKAEKEEQEARKAEEKRLKDEQEAQKKAEKEEMEAKKRAEKEELEAKKKAEKEELEAKKKAEKEELEAKKKAEKEELEARKAEEKRMKEEQEAQKKAEKEEQKAKEKREKEEKEASEKAKKEEQKAKEKAEKEAEKRNKEELEAKKKAEKEAQKTKEQQTKADKEAMKKAEKEEKEAKKKAAKEEKEAMKRQKKEERKAEKLAKKQAAAADPLAVPEVSFDADNKKDEKKGKKKGKAWLWILIVLLLLLLLGCAAVYLGKPAFVKPAHEWFFTNVLKQNQRETAELDIDNMVTNSGQDQTVSSQQATASRQQAAVSGPAMAAAEVYADACLFSFSELLTEFDAGDIENRSNAINDYLSGYITNYLKEKRYTTAKVPMMERIHQYSVSRLTELYDNSGYAEERFIPSADYVSKYITDYKKAHKGRQKQVMVQSEIMDHTFLDNMLSGMVDELGLKADDAKVQMPPKTEPVVPVIKTEKKSRQGFDLIAGFYTNATTAQKMVDRLKGYGCNAYIIEINHGYYVSMGSDKTRTMAEEQYRQAKEWYDGDISIKSF